MNRRCKAKKKSGEPCRAVAGANGLCNLHGIPTRPAELGRRSGRSRRYVLPLEKTDPELAPGKGRAARLIKHSPSHCLAVVSRKNNEV